MSARSSPTRRDQARHAIAQRVAVLIVTEGLSWREAREQVFSDCLRESRDIFPGGPEIESAVRENFAIFAPEEHAALLLRRRRLAAWLLNDLFAGLPVYLTGAVLNGAAGPDSWITLETFGDDPKEALLRVVDAGYALKPGELAPALPFRPLETVLFDVASVDEVVGCQLSVYPLSAHSRAPRARLADPWQREWEAQRRIDGQTLARLLAEDGS